MQHQLRSPLVGDFISPRVRGHQAVPRRLLPRFNPLSSGTFISPQPRVLRGATQRSRVSIPSRRGRSSRRRCGPPTSATGEFQSPLVGDVHLAILAQAASAASQSFNPLSSGTVISPRISRSSARQRRADSFQSPLVGDASRPRQHPEIVIVSGFVSIPSRRGRSSRRSSETRLPVLANRYRVSIPSRRGRSSRLLSRLLPCGAEPESFNPLSSGTFISPARRCSRTELTRSCFNPLSSGTFISPSSRGSTWARRSSFNPLSSGTFISPADGALYACVLEFDIRFNPLSSGTFISPSPTRCTRCSVPTPVSIPSRRGRSSRRSSRSLVSPSRASRRFQSPLVGDVHLASVKLTPHGIAGIIKMFQSPLVGDVHLALHQLVDFRPRVQSHKFQSPLVGDVHLA